MKNAHTRYSFIDIHSFSELRAQPLLLEQLIHLYQCIFAEPDIWNEHYSVADIKQKLRNELQGTASLRLCVTASGTNHEEKNASREVIGFCWAQVLSPQQVLNAIESVPYIQASIANKSGKLSQSLQDIAGKQPVIYLQDLGIAKAYRQTIPLDQLIAPVLESVAQRGKLREVFFWSVHQTCISWLASKFGVPKVNTLEDAVFFKGTLPNPQQIQQVLDMSA